jgi:hypothetical protein
MVAIIRGGSKRKIQSENCCAANRFAMNIGGIQAIPEPIVEINGIKVTVEVLAHAISALTNPDPKKWYRFERRGDVVAVEAKYEPCPLIQFLHAFTPLCKTKH